MTGSIFTLRPDGTLDTMEEAAYLTEDELQALLAEYPKLMPGDQVSPSSPRRWLLVTREAAVPDEGGDRWSLDHLFLDQNGIPTLVEVKRSTDTRIRREVVGQMLDYAANAVAHWPVESIQAFLATRCESESVDLDEAVLELLGEKDEGNAEELVDAFWADVKTNITAGRIRLIFLADSIPSELRRIIEFLNEQMDPAEVLGIEIKRYRSGDLTSLVPKVVGQTAQAERRKSIPSTRGEPWTRERFFQDIHDRGLSTDIAETAQKLLDWAEAKGLEIRPGRGAVYGSFNVRFDSREGAVPLFVLWSEGTVQLPMGSFAKTSPMKDEAARLELLGKLNQIPGMQLPPSAIRKYPNASLEAITSEASFDHFVECLDWILARFAEGERASE